jgi:hypothetical protein
MKIANQQTLPGIRDWREPQIVSAQRLASMITEANAAGFDAVRMECWRNPFGYRVTFQRMDSARHVKTVSPYGLGVKESPWRSISARDLSTCRENP